VRVELAIRIGIHTRRVVAGAIGAGATRERLAVRGSVTESFEQKALRKAAGEVGPWRRFVRLASDAISLAQMAAQEREHLLHLVAVLCRVGEDVVVPSPLVIHSLYRLAGGS